MEVHNRLGRQARRLCALAAAVLWTFALLPAGAAEEHRVLRVGFPIQEGFSMVDGQGNFSGYTYDYLQEIAQYTGWEYEFVTLEGDINDTIGEMLVMLRDGELDLMGAMSYSDSLAEIYEYPGSSYGVVSSCLVVPEGSTSVTENNFYRMQGLRIGVLERAAGRNAELEAFCRGNDMQPVLVECDTQEQQLELLESGAVDAITWQDVNYMQGLRVVAKYAPKPFYLATTKGNGAIMAQLNNAIMKINEGDPYFSTTLYQKYFGSGKEAFFLSDEEQAYVARASSIRVAYVTDKAPVQFQDREGAFRGVSREIFDYISDQTGLSFTYIPVSDQQELIDLLQAGQVDLLAGIPTDQETGELYGVSFTRPYLESQMALAVRSGVDAGSLEGCRIVLPLGVSYEGADTEDMAWLNSVEDCIRAVNSGEADYTYGNGYTMQYYANQPGYRNLTVIPGSGLTQRVAVGIARPVDVTLLTLLNKAVRSLPEEELQAIIYRNAVYTPELGLVSYIQANPALGLTLIAVPAAVIIALLLLFLHSRGKLSRRLATENERYLQLCELSGEYIWEYDFQADRLTLSEQCAQVFGGRAAVREHYLAAPEGGGDGFYRRLIRDGGGSTELPIAMPDGGTRWFRSVSKITLDAQGKPAYAVGKLVDIQAEKEELQRLEERAQRDSLTGVYNAAASRQLVKRRLEEGAGGALLLLDIDHFKQVNDEHGHYTGDQVLIAVAEALAGRFRREDVVGRPGGDEFLVYMAGVTEARVVEDKCAQLLSDCAELRGGKVSGLSVTLSIGAAMADTCREYEALYRRADEALYRVKHRGRDGYEFYQEVRA